MGKCACGLLQTVQASSVALFGVCGCEFQSRQSHQPHTLWRTTEMALKRSGLRPRALKLCSIWPKKGCATNFRQRHQETHCCTLAPRCHLTLTLPPYPHAARLTMAHQFRTAVQAACRFYCVPMALGVAAVAPPPQEETLGNTWAVQLLLLPRPKHTILNNSCLRKRKCKHKQNPTSVDMTSLT